MDSIEKNEKHIQEARRYWDNQAATFDQEPDHGLRDPQTLAAWTELLKTWLPSTPIEVLDIGCGTGSLSVVLAGLGHQVTGIDLSPAMLAQARDKAAAHGYQIEFQVMNAALLELPEQRFDLLICRHLLWALPEPEKVLLRWLELLKPGGRLCLVEGYWGTGAGLRAKEIRALLPAAFRKVSILNLSDNHLLWGREVTDERYAIITDL